MDDDVMVAAFGEGEGEDLAEDLDDSRLLGYGDGNKTPLRIHGSFGRGESDAPDTREYRNLNMTILHAVSLKLVKELGCENNGGLPKSPVLTPK
ncbi:hypothetical protein ACFV8T_02975 [Streptomyces sp. NPDC059832]|uniref:hypothetical protein n=1 Tax=Streptomyces sp. NPDC059832 TaxID=3346966 RepID=UPI0036651E8A